MTNTFISTDYQLLNFFSIFLSTWREGQQKSWSFYVTVFKNLCQRSWVTPHLGEPYPQLLLHLLKMISLPSNLMMFVTSKPLNIGESGFLKIFIFYCYSQDIPSSGRSSPNHFSCCSSHSITKVVELSSSRTKWPFEECRSCKWNLYRWRSGYVIKKLTLQLYGFGFNSTRWNFE